MSLHQLTRKRIYRSVGLKWNECPFPLQGDFPAEGSRVREGKQLP